MVTQSRSAAILEGVPTWICCWVSCVKRRCRAISCMQATHWPAPRASLSRSCRVVRVSFTRWTTCVVDLQAAKFEGMGTDGPRLAKACVRVGAGPPGCSFGSPNEDCLPFPRWLGFHLLQQRPVSETHKRVHLSGLYFSYGPYQSYQILFIIWRDRTVRIESSALTSFFQSADNSQNLARD